MWYYIKKLPSIVPALKVANHLRLIQFARGMAQHLLITSSRGVVSFESQRQILYHCLLAERWDCVGMKNIAYFKGESISNERGSWSGLEYIHLSYHSPVTPKYPAQSINTNVPSVRVLASPQFNSGKYCAIFIGSPYAFGLNSGLSGMTGCCW